jgi:AraC-like DNA-binding protein
MDKSIRRMDYPLMSLLMSRAPLADSTVLVLKSFHHVPDSRGGRGFSFLSRAGHFRAGSLYRNERTSVPGHEIFFCVKGCGYVRQTGKSERVTAGRLVWIDVNHPHVHWADRDDPWEVYWLRAEGIQLEAAYSMLCSRGSFCVDPFEAPEPVFKRIFQLFEERRQPFDALANAEVARMIALFAGSIQAGYGREGLMPQIAGILEEMRIYYQRSWRVKDIASHCGKSPAQIHRIFQSAIGSSPIAYIRRIRIEQAMQKLLSTGDSVAEIAYQVGYNDPFFFSRDFKKAVGRSPTEYWAHERKH